METRAAENENLIYNSYNNNISMKFYLNLIFE